MATTELHAQVTGMPGAAAGRVMQRLIANNTRISCMESCTSGLFASTITDTEGASAVFLGSQVTYSNEAKVAAGVDAGVIERHGVYSSECARAMAQAQQRAFGSAVTVGITGTTGNLDPNNADSVAGEVFFCILVGSVPHDYHLLLSTGGCIRHSIKQTIVNVVFEELETLLLAP